MWLTSKEIRSKLKITPQTLWNKVNKGLIESKEIKGTKYYFLEEELNDNRSNVIYSRVSNSKQKEDLIRQELVLREYAVSSGHIIHDVYSDIASGMNDNRIGLNKLLDRVISREIDTIFISHKDRLTRFGFNYIKYLCSKFDTKIKVVNLTKEEDFQSELTNDLISIIHHFSMKMYSNRRKELNALKKNLKND